MDDRLEQLVEMECADALLDGGDNRVQTYKPVI